MNKKLVLTALVSVIVGLFAGFNIPKPNQPNSSLPLVITDALPDSILTFEGYSAGFFDNIKPANPVILVSWKEDGNKCLCTLPAGAWKNLVNKNPQRGDQIRIIPTSNSNRLPDAEIVSR